MTPPEFAPEEVYFLGVRDLDFFGAIRIGFREGGRMIVPCESMLIDVVSQSESDGGDWEGYLDMDGAGISGQV